MDESNIEEGRLNSILKSRNRFPLHEVQGFFPEEDTVTSTFTKNRRVSFGRKCVKEFQIGSAVSTQALDEYEQSASFSDPSECSGPLDLALNKTCQGPEIDENKEDNLITPPECFSDTKPRAPEDRARLFTENCISIAKSVFQDTETELTAIIIGAKPTNTDDERKNMSVNFSTLDISHDFIPVRHPELFSEQSHPVDKSRFDFLDHLATNKLGIKTPRTAQRTPLARIATPWDDENDENIPPAHRSYRQVSTPIHREFISEPTMEFTCANIKSNRQQIICNDSVNYGSDMEETCGRRLVNSTQRSLDMSCTGGAWNNVFDDNNDEDDDDDDEDPLKLDAPPDDFLADLSGLDKTVTPSDTEDSPFCSIQKELANLSVANKSFRDRFELNQSGRSLLFSPAPASPLVLSPCVDPLLFTPTCANIRASNDDMEMTEARAIPASNSNNSCNASAVLTPCSDLPFSPTCVNMHFKTGENDMEITEVVRRPANLSDDSLLATSLVISPNGPITPLQFSPTCQNIKLSPSGVGEMENDDMEITTNKKVVVESNDMTELKDSEISPLCYAPTPMRKSKTSPAKELNFVIVESSHETSEPSKNVENCSENRVEIESIELIQSQQDEIISENEVDMNITQVNHSKCSEMISEILPERQTSESEKEVEPDLNRSTTEDNGDQIVDEIDVATTVTSDDGNHETKSSDENKEIDMDLTQDNHSKCSQMINEIIPEKLTSESDKEVEPDMNISNMTRSTTEDNGDEIDVATTVTSDDGNQETKSSDEKKEIDMDLTQVNHSKCSQMLNEIIPEKLTSESDKEVEPDMNISNITRSTTEDNGDQIVHEIDVASDEGNHETKSSYEYKESDMDITQVNHSKCSEMISEILPKKLISESDKDVEPDINRSTTEDNGDQIVDEIDIAATVTSDDGNHETKITDENKESDMDITQVNHSKCSEMINEILPEKLTSEKEKEVETDINISNITRSTTEDNGDEIDIATTVTSDDGNHEIKITDENKESDMDITQVNHSKCSEMINEILPEKLTSKSDKEVDPDMNISNISRSTTEDNGDQIVDGIYVATTVTDEGNHETKSSDENKGSDMDIIQVNLSQCSEMINEILPEKLTSKSEQEVEPNMIISNITRSTTEDNGDQIVDEIHVATTVTSDDGNHETKSLDENKESDMYITQVNHSKCSEMICEILSEKFTSESEKEVEPDMNISNITRSSTKDNGNQIVDGIDVATTVTDEGNHETKSSDENKEIELGIQRLEITEEDTVGTSEDTYTYTLKSNCEKTYTVEINDETKVLENSLKNKRQTYVIPEKRPHSDSPCQSQRLKKNRMSDSPMPLRRSARLDASLNRSKTETIQLSTPKSQKKDAFGKRIHSDSPLIGDASLKKGRPSASPLVGKNLSALMDNDVSYAGPTRFSANLETSITLQECSIENESDKELSMVLPETVDAVSSTIDSPENSPQTSESPRRRTSNVSFGIFPHEPSVVINKPSFIIEEDIENDVPLTINTLRENSITVPNLAVPDLDDDDFEFEHDVSSSTKKIDDLFKKSIILIETNGEDVTSTNMSIIDEILKLPHSIDLPNISNINSTRNISNTNCKEVDDHSEMEGVETDLFQQTYKNVLSILEEKSKTNGCNWKVLSSQSEDNTISLEFPLLEAGLSLQVIFDKSSKIISMQTSEKLALLYQTKIKTHVNTYGYNFLKNLIKNQEEKLKCLEELPMFIDLFSGFAKRLVEAMNDALVVLKGCASAELSENILSFRINYYMPLTSCLVDVDLNELTMLGQPSIRLRHEMGRVSEHTLRHLMPKPQPNLLQVFVKAVTNYTINLEAKTGFVTKRPQLLF